MITLVKTISAEVDKFKMRIIKVLRMGRTDVRTADESMPYGIDSHPVKDIIAVYAATGEKGESVIIGYLNKNQMAKAGELRLYATDADGAQKFYTWMKDDGTYEIGGSAKHLARFEELEAGFNNLKQHHNDLVNAFNAHMHPTAGTGPPSTPTPGSGIPAQPSNASIASAKIDQIKTL